MQGFPEQVPVFDSIIFYLACMTRKILLYLSFIVVSVTVSAQPHPFEKISFILGQWEGSGTGFGNEKSKISSSFQLVMNDKYIEVSNESQFEPTEEDPEGELHIDKGFISFDKVRKRVVFRQFHIEGYITTYLLVDSLSSKNTLVFETEQIENFVNGGKARLTINRIDEDEIETIFDVSFPDQPYTCFGTNRLQRK
jgi:hypothetical protein